MSNNKMIRMRKLVGGLEQSDRGLIVIGGREYRISDKAKYGLMSNLHSWISFLDVYRDSIRIEGLFREVSNLLNLKTTNDMKDYMVEIVEQVYKATDEQHINCMADQYYLKEHLITAAYQVFVTLKRHFEFLVRTFITQRDRYITEHKLECKVNNLPKLMKQWQDIDNINENDTTSLLLFYINPPPEYNAPPIHLKFDCAPGGNTDIAVDNNDSVADKQARATDRSLDRTISKVNVLMKPVVKYRYQGFCQKRAPERIIELLKFPYGNIRTAIHAIDPTVSLPDYSKLDADMSATLKYIPKPKVSKVSKMRKPDSALEYMAKLSIEDNEDKADIISNAKIKLTKWYVSEIMKRRRALIDQLAKYEEYFNALAKQLADLDKILDDHLRDYC